ncbi:MAG TPA: hypothetical protein VMS60_15920 [Solirubrobacterales bacterium]|nr:hypothetical protein [Solirubrobacterales bacterium]
MTYAFLALTILVIAASAAVVITLERRRGIRRHLRRSIVIHTVDSRSLKGVLIGEFADTIELAHTEYLHGGEESLLAGTILIPRDQIAFVQVVPAATGAVA